MTDPLAPNSTIGILGGGQLGRMLSVAASRLGLKTHVFEPQPHCPAGDVAHRVTTAPYEDADAIRAFAGSVDVVTYEFENVPTAALDLIEDSTPIRPGRNALAVSQDRATEKTFLEGLGIGVAPWAPVDDEATLAEATARIGVPSILKTRTLGYDGKGQVRINAAEEALAAWDALGRAPCVLEGFVPFQREVSVIAARSTAGDLIAYDPGENVHRNGILHTTTVSSAVARGIKADAVLTAGRILNALDYVGVMGVEMFVMPGNKLLVNEIAPRVHNSGHWTIEGCVIDQFQQHIRAVAGWPLGDGERHSDAVMTNLIGADADDWQRLADTGSGTGAGTRSGTGSGTLAASGSGVREPSGGLHLYGKAESRPGRKMGHITRISPKT